MADPRIPAALAPLYGALAPDPNAEYGTLLPFARDKTTGARRWAMPQMARDGAKGMLDLMAGTETGEVTPEAVQSLVFGGLAGGGALAPRGALASGGAPIRAYHGSPHDFDRFDARKIGAGEGGQSYGHGLYFAENPAVAQSYKDTFGRAAPGKMYEVGIHEDPRLMLNWDSPVAAQPARARELAGDLGVLRDRTLDMTDLKQQLQRMLGEKVQSTPHSIPLPAATNGAEMYNGIIGELARRNPGADMNKLARSFPAADIPGIRYLDGMSREGGKGTSNYVMFPGTEESIEILRKYGLAAPLPLALSGGASSPGAQREAITNRVY